ncbi:MAG: metal-dependent hydrolase [Thiovulaceae bacterium]|nr:metal-dependent hydrolase [Sulfurimonadaceae bacterium]
MKAFTPTYLFTPKGFVKEHTLIFDKKIIAVGPSDEILKQYPNAISQTLPKYSVVMPGLINSHVHLEFSANKSSLKYGRFMPWLYSVIKKRDELIPLCKQECLQKAIESMILSGTTSFGAISSYATEMQACIDTPAKVVFFNELIGSNAAMADTLWGDFVQRLDGSKHASSETFFPAIAVHSPYAVHPILVRKAVAIAKNETLPLTAHLLESRAEKEWLEDNSGEFAPFFEDFLQQKTAVTTVKEFIDCFDTVPTLFTHATQLEESHAKQLSQKDHTVIHCPVSNRLLGNGVLDLKQLYEHAIDYVCGTDGLSSNYSLNLFEELKSALYMHDDADLDTLSLSLLHSVTTTAGKALRLNTGRLEADFDADILVFDLNNDDIYDEDLALHIILQQFELKQIYINGEIYAKN